MFGYIPFGKVSKPNREVKRTTAISNAEHNTEILLPENIRTEETNSTVPSEHCAVMNRHYRQRITFQQIIQRKGCESRQRSVQWSRYLKEQCFGRRFPGLPVCPSEKSSSTKRRVRSVGGMLLTECLWNDTDGGFVEWY